MKVVLYQIHWGNSSTDSGNQEVWTDNLVDAKSHKAANRGSWITEHVFKGTYKEIIACLCGFMADSEWSESANSDVGERSSSEVK